MTVGSVARLTIIVCLLAAVVETVLGGIAPSGLPSYLATVLRGISPSGLACGMGSPFALIVLFVIGPYLLLSLFAWRQRGQPAASWMLLAVAVGMSAWGLYVFGGDTYRYHTELQYFMVQRMAVLFVPLVQWAIVLLVGLALLVRRLGTLLWIDRHGSWDGPPPETAEERKAKFLTAGDECIDRFSPKADYKEKRRAGILATFDWLLGLSRHHHWRKTRSRGHEAEQDTTADRPRE